MPEKLFETRSIVSNRSRYTDTREDKGLKTLTKSALRSIGDKRPSARPQALSVHSSKIKQDIIEAQNKAFPTLTSPVPNEPLLKMG